MIEALEIELSLIDTKLHFLLKRGANDESLVDEKREIQNQLRILKKEKHVHTREY